MIERVKTGIDGLDKALNGGIPARNLVLISGGAGTGKSTLCMQFLYNGAKKFGEKGLYVSTEQREQDLRKQAEQYGWNLMELEEKGLLKIVFIDIVKENHFLERLREAIKLFRPKRLIIDSLSTLADYTAVTDYSKKSWTFAQIQSEIIPTAVTENIMTKKILVALISELKEFDSTVLLTSELPEGTNDLSADKISEFITDGIIVLYHTNIGGEAFGNIQIRKMRYTSHSHALYNLLITQHGIEIGEETTVMK
ncbi:MAG: ATPase domain-containing protein [Candidatus Diapherotrites archaeon]